MYGGGQDWSDGQGGWILTYVTIEVMSKLFHMYITIADSFCFLTRFNCPQGLMILMMRPIPFQNKGY